MKTIYLTKCPKLNDRTMIQTPAVYGSNSGNFAFMYSLQNTIKCVPKTPEQLLEMDNADVDNIITHNLIWLRENVDLGGMTLINLLKRFDKPIIPISIGLQADRFQSKFSFHPNVLRILQEMQERAVLGVRGEYTAYMLDRNGIHNIRVIGCPSMYVKTDYNRRVYQKDFSAVSSVMSNYRTLSNKIDNPLDLSILDYLRDNTQVFVEQTPCYASRAVLDGVLKDKTEFLIQKRRVFCVYDNWQSFAKKYDFSIGGRFHGNAMAILAGLPALFIISDSRTEELTDFFDFPTIRREEFDTQKPLKYYYELADYSTFNRNYPKKLDNFIRFCLDNNLELTSGMGQYFTRCQSELNRKTTNLIHEFLTL